MSGRPKPQVPQASAGPFEITIENLSHEGAGIARQADGKTIFIADALPGERVRYRRTQRKSDFDQGRLLEILQAAPERVIPPCRYFGTCGGCSLQHLDPAAQVEFKQRGLLDNLARIGRLQPEQILLPLVGPTLGYRRRARLAVRYDHKAGQIRLGFQARDSREITALGACLILDPVFGDRLTELADLINALSVREQIPQIEVAVGDDASAMVLRVLREPNASDRERLADFAHSTDIGIWLQRQDAGELQALVPGTPSLHYRLPAHDVEIQFAPSDFVQINAEVNRRMVDQALSLLALRPHERALDLFAGLGNFSLPIARQVEQVVAVEGEQRLVEQGRRNAGINGLANVQHYQSDLNLAGESEAWLRMDYDAVLLDPPRTGARAILPLIAARTPSRILYVSCHPGTLARDAALLAHEHGYRLRAAGIVDMFPHTSHVESMALFEAG